MIYDELYPAGTILHYHLSDSYVIPSGWCLCGKGPGYDADPEQADPYDSARAEAARVVLIRKL